MPLIRSAAPSPPPRPPAPAGLQHPQPEAPQLARPHHPPRELRPRLQLGPADARHLSGPAQVHGCGHGCQEGSRRCMQAAASPSSAPGPARLGIIKGWRATDCSGAEGWQGGRLCGTGAAATQCATAAAPQGAAPQRRTSPAACLAPHRQKQGSRNVEREGSPGAAHLLAPPPPTAASETARTGYAPPPRPVCVYTRGWH